MTFDRHNSHSDGPNAYPLPMQARMHNLTMTKLSSIALILASSTYTCSAETVPQHRVLATMEKIGGYQPLTDVRDAASIDKDNALIEKLLLEDEFEAAQLVYEKGTFSRTIATVEFGFEGLPKDIPAHTPVTGESDSGTEVNGMLLEKGKMGAKTVHIVYHNADNVMKCYVGGNPQPIVTGCFASSGELQFEGIDNAISYAYNEIQDNKNDRTIAMFSTHANDKMRPCAKCELYNDFTRLSKFYGSLDFADKWIKAALTGTRVVFDASTADFLSLKSELRAAAANTAIVTLSMLPYIERELEEAVKQCMARCPPEGCSDKAVNAGDIAAAFYFGSLEDGSGNGKLMNALATRECAHFHTCGKDGDSGHGTAKVDLEILREMQAMQTNLTTRACPEAGQHRDHIEKWMKVPLIQGALRVAHLRANGKATDADIGTGAALSASIVPFVAACSFKDAEIIDNNLETTAATTDFKLVKEAFERSYTCLGLTCKDIGGYWDRGKRDYYKDAEPCVFDVKKEVEEGSEKKGMGWGVGIASFLVVALLCVVRRRRLKAAQKKKSRKGSNVMDDFSDSSDDSDGPRFT